MIAALRFTAMGVWGTWIGCTVGFASRPIFAAGPLLWGALSVAASVGDRRCRR